MSVAFGIFDHMERNEVPLDQLYEQRLQLLEAADRAGIFCYHVAEHHSTPLGMAPSPNVFLAALAMRTRKIHFGPLVYLLPLYHPIRLVEEICMLDNLSEGRLEVGVGRGISPYELGYFDVGFLESREIFEESLKAIVQGLRERKMSHRGERYQFAGAPMELTPKQKPNPPFWYGASTPDGLAFAARHRMQIVTGGPDGIVKGTATAYRELLDKFRDSPDNLNPHIAEPKIGGLRHFFIADTDKEALEIATPAYRVYYNNIVKLWRDFGTVPTLFTDDLARAIAGQAAIVGSPRSVRERIAAYFAESGTNYLVLSFAWGGLTFEQSRHSMELFASEVMPHFVKRTER
ncbi:MAG TPA: LLM class flavin-dependent oxidoreductase [Candidatus Binataceae bacterium]|nr:LLM class flavin-dependent oxidoreductase [Candidatus Binataceae bacterium]